MRHISHLEELLLCYFEAFTTGISTDIIYRIKQSIIEEGYELIETLDQKDWEKVADESGDLLLQIVF